MITAFTVEARTQNIKTCPESCFLELETYAVVLGEAEHQRVVEVQRVVTAVV
jgi:hypothetical protein